MLKVGYMPSREGLPNNSISDAPIADNNIKQLAFKCPCCGATLYFQTILALAHKTDISYNSNNCKERSK